jgi:hypothetical protein
LRQNLQQVAPNQEKPHTTPLHSLIYSIYISVVNSGNLRSWTVDTGQSCRHLNGEQQ